MRWHNERIVKAIKQRMVGDFIHVETAAELMRIMRDDYEAALKEMSKRIAVLEDMVDVQGDRISTALAANAELAAKLKVK